MISRVLARHMTEDLDEEHDLDFDLHLDFASGGLPDSYADVVQGMNALAGLRVLEERRRATFRIV